VTPPQFGTIMPCNKASVLTEIAIF